MLVIASFLLGLSPGHRSCLVVLPTPSLINKTQNCFPHQKKSILANGRNGSAVKSSFGGSVLGSQHPEGSSSSRVYNTLFWPLWGLDTHVAHIQTYMQTKHTYNKNKCYENSARANYCALRTLELRTLGWESVCMSSSGGWSRKLNHPCSVTGLPNCLQRRHTIFTHIRNRFKFLHPQAMPWTLCLKTMLAWFPLALNF